MLVGDIDLQNRGLLWIIRIGAAIVASLSLIALIRLGYRYEWTGFGAAPLPKSSAQEIRPRKTLWDWLQLLIVPLAIAGIGFWFTLQQDAQRQAIEDQRAQDTALQAYLDQVSTLLLEKELRSSAKDSEVRRLAQTRTLTLLGTLDGERKRSVLRFLYEASLIDRSDPVISLDGANLRDMDLNLVNLSGGPFVIPSHYGSDRAASFGLPGAEFGGDGADLSGADLSGSDLRYCALVGVDLKGADFSNADLTGCGLSPDFTNVPSSVMGPSVSQDIPEGPPGDPDLRVIGSSTREPRVLPKGAIKTDLTGAFFNQANLRYAVFPNADLSGADLISADLRSAWLVETDLRNTNFSKADLRDAHLNYAIMNENTSFEDADLSGADLSEVVGLDVEKLKRQAKSLNGTIMPKE